MTIALPSLLVFSDDWGRHPSSCQHLIRCLLASHQVIWVNTIGTRRPRLNWSTLKRGLEKLGQWMAPTDHSDVLPEHLQVTSPKMWPWMSSRFDRWLNRKLLVQQLGPLLRSLPSPPIAITTLPIVADLVSELDVSKWVYYCVDDFSEWPGLDQETLRRMENDLLTEVDTVIAVSRNLQERLRRQGIGAHLLTHGVELGFWNSPLVGADVPELQGLERPLIVFWGVVDQRMDVTFVEQLSRDLSQGSIVLIGPDAEPDAKLLSLPRIVRVPPIEFHQLPVVAREAAVFIMPYADLPVTRAIQPLKLKEYLATGKPTVVRRLPATEEWQDCLDLVETPEEFSKAVRLRLREGISPNQKRARARLSHESWQAKAEQFLEYAQGPCL